MILPSFPIYFVSSRERPWRQWAVTVFLEVRKSTVLYSNKSMQWSCNLRVLTWLSKVCWGLTPDGRTWTWPWDRLRPLGLTFIFSSSGDPPIPGGVDARFGLVPMMSDWDSMMLRSWNWREWRSSICSGLSRGPEKSFCWIDGWKVQSETEREKWPEALVGVCGIEKHGTKFTMVIDRVHH